MLKVPLRLTLAPPFLLGGVLGLFDIHYDYLGSNLVEIWLGLYGCGLCAAGMYLTRGVRLLGWLFVLSALVTTAVQHPWGIMQFTRLAEELAVAGARDRRHVAATERGQ